MNIPVSKATTAHYVWGDVSYGWRLVTQQSLSVIEERVPTGASEVRHFHKISRQFFYVLSGEATIEIENIEHLIRSGSGIEVAPGERHRFMNKGSADVTFLVISSPTTIGDRFEVESGPA